MSEAYILAKVEQKLIDSLWSTVSEHDLRPGDTAYIKGPEVRKLNTEALNILILIGQIRCEEVIDGEMSKVWDGLANPTKDQGFDPLRYEHNH